MRDIVAVIAKRFGGRNAIAIPTPGARVAKSWAEQNCPRELQELRDAQTILQRETGSVRAAPALLGTAGRAGAVAQQLDAPIRELGVRLDRFFAAEDATTAAATLKAFNDQLTIVARAAAVR